MKRMQSGFTLIELVVVIVILGILAVSAVPRFVNLQDQAELATIDGVKGALESAAALNYAKELADDGGIITDQATCSDLIGAGATSLLQAAVTLPTGWSLNGTIPDSAEGDADTTCALTDGTTTRNVTILIVE